jgi:hypothetical protein
LLCRLFPSKTLLFNGGLPVCSSTRRAPGRVAVTLIPHPEVAGFGVNLGKYGLKIAQKQVKSGEKTSKINATFR